MDVHETYDSTEQVDEASVEELEHNMWRIDTLNASDGSPYTALRASA